MGELIMPTRRRLILGAVFSLITAPAIVRATSIMPVKPFGVLEAIGFETGELTIEEYLASYRVLQRVFHFAISRDEYRRAPFSNRS